MKKKEGNEEILDNPMVDIATYLFLEDIADKQGAAGMNNYLISLAYSLARSMPEEEYSKWEDFVEAIVKGESILSAFETVNAVSENCMVTVESPFLRGWKEYTKRIGEFPRIHKEVAEYYNSQITPTAIETGDIIIQTYRKAAAEKITVSGKKINVAHIATVSPDGSKKIAPEEWLPILLEKAKISRTQLNMILRNNASVWLVYPTL
ncbi:MAG: hypothetical protein GXO25_07740 [Euryarchaeota archaeon]|nr:hypothetical protein [Euryarchaeota archaeon]